MNDKKTTYDKLVKHIDKAQKVMDLLTIEHKPDPYRALEKAMNDYSDFVGDRHQAGTVMQGMAALFIDRSRLQKPMTADEIHEKNLAAVARQEEIKNKSEEERTLREDENKQIEALKEFINSHTKAQVIWLIEDSDKKGFDLIRHSYNPVQEFAKFLVDFFAIGGLTPPDNWEYPSGGKADEFYTELLKDIYSTN